MAVRLREYKPAASVLNILHKTSLDGRTKTIIPLIYSVSFVTETNLIYIDIL